MNKLNKYSVEFTDPKIRGKSHVISDSITTAYAIAENWLRDNLKVNNSITLIKMDEAMRKITHEYTYDFLSECPVNGGLITYRLAITTSEKIMAEHIVARCAMHRKALHEDIAKDLLEAFPGSQKLTARHGQVTIKTMADVYA